MVRSAARAAFPFVAGLFAVCAIIQVFLAGLGVFDDASAFVTHRDFGYMISLLPIVLVVLALVGGMPRRYAGLSALLFVLFLLQSVFVQMRDSMPAVAALHPLNGFLILALGILLAWQSWQARSTSSTATA
jgi:mercuric ion transport protein